MIQTTRHSFRASSRRQRGWALLCLVATVVAAPAQLFINEILFNPPGPDTPNEYIELRGTPNAVLPNGTYFVAVNGDAGSGPGTPQNVFDLSGRAVGGNGFLVLLPKGTPYGANSNATILVNTNDPGWGSGAGSSIGHRGAGGQSELQNASVTFFLIQTTNPPAFSDDIDPGNTGVPHGPVWDSWTVLDSVGVLDNDGAGDFAYGAINFRRNAGASATGTVVAVGFTPGYVGRTTNSTGAAAGDWVAGDNLSGSAPNWSLGNSSSTVPSTFAGLPLNHLGGPNFGAAAFSGVVAVPSGGSTVVAEGGATDSYRLGLNTTPGGSVTVRVWTDNALQITTNGTSWTNSLAIVFSNTNQTTLTVRAPADNVLDTSPHWAAIHHAITNTADAARYPTSALGPVVNVAIDEKDALLLSELKVNPPGTNDAPWEFVEIKGPPNALLTNIYFLALEGSSTKNPGTVNLAVNLTSARLGSSGLLVLGATNNPYGVAAGVTLFGDGRFNQPGSTLPNGVQSFLLVSSPQPFVEGVDLDAGDNGLLEGLPEGTTVLDGVGFSDSDPTDVFYSSAVLALPSATPDAATRFPGNTNANSEAAWGFGNLAGTSGSSLEYDSASASTNLPPGTLLTPGAANNTAPAITVLLPLSGVIGDAANPLVSFTVSDSETPANLLTVSVSSTNQSVVPDANLVLTAGAGGAHTLAITPVGVGYTLITVTASDGSMTGWGSFLYAASAPGRPGGHFHTMVSDGSAAFAVDTNLMFVGDDENQTLRLYKRNESGGPLESFDFTPWLNLTDLYGNGTPKEMDIEASTRVGNRIFWLGSGSNAETGEAHPNRNRVFATDLSGAGTNSQLAFAGRYEHLKDDILAWDARNLHGKGSNYYGLVASAAVGLNPKEEDGSGFNIEGLTMAPGNTNVAYIGLRAPYVPPTNRAKALILVVSNFSTLAVSGAAAGATVFGPPIELNLIRRGIRSMEANTNGVLIVAGPAGKFTGAPPSDFRLFTWSGRPGDAPQERRADLSGLNPEGLVEPPPAPWTSNSVAELISDNGTSVYYGDGVEAKHLPIPAFKKFRSDRVPLGPVVVSKPILRPVGRSGGQFVLSWYSVEGLTNAVQFRTNLTLGAWSDLPGDIRVTDAVTWKSVTPPGPQCFYRVVVR